MSTAARIAQNYAARLCEIVRMSHLRESGLARAEVATLIYAMSNEPDLLSDRIHIEQLEISARGNTIREIRFRRG